MSAEATGWVWRHSPLDGTAFAVHLAMADSVNDQNGNEFWMTVTNLAIKARASERSVQRALRTLENDRLIATVGMGPSGAVRYRFLFPDTPVVFESRVIHRGDTTSPPGRHHDTPRVTPRHPRGDTVTPHNPKGTQREPNPTVARALTLLAEREVAAWAAAGGQIRNRNGAIAHKRDQLAPELTPILDRLVASHPDADPAGLLALLDEQVVLARRLDAAQAHGRNLASAALAPDEAESLLRSEWAGRLGDAAVAAFHDTRKEAA